MAHRKQANRRRFSAPLDVNTPSPVSGEGWGEGFSGRRAGGEGQPIVYVLGGAGAGPSRNPALRDFPLLNRVSDEAEAAHVMRVARRIDQSIASGGTHLVVPHALADWLGDHPLLIDYFAGHHDLVEASKRSGIVFALRPRNHAVFRAEIDGWQVRPGDGIVLHAPSRLIAPKLSLVSTSSIRGLRRGHLVLSAHRLRTLHIRFVLGRPDRRQTRRADLYLSLERPGFLIHQLPFVEATFRSNGEVELDFDLKLDRGRALERVELGLVEEDNWRLHPMYPRNRSIELPAVAPAGARLELKAFTLESTPRLRKGAPFGAVKAERPAPYRKPAAHPRDAVIFSSWVPDEGLALGDYFIETLQRYHADSKIFVGINHYASPVWRERLEASGLDVTIAEPPLTQTMRYDPTGFIAALDAYRRHTEPFDLVWFGHTKGLGHIDEFWYGTGRWMIERMFWSRRQEIEHHFQNPMIGLYAPHYLMMLQNHLAQTDALQRIYRGICAPLGMMAVSSHYVMREESVREFCREVDPRFFLHGADPFGGDIYFFEMAMPNVPIMQGFEPAIEPGLGGTSRTPQIDGVESGLNDWRHNNAVVAIELAKWRQDPIHFRTLHCEHNQVD